MDHAGRFARLRRRLEAEELDALHVTHLPNVRYLCGFTGSSGSLLVGREAAWFFTDGRYRTQSSEEVADAEVGVYTQPQELTDLLQRAGGEAGRSIGVEAGHVTISGLDRLTDQLEGWELISTSGWVEDLRRVKEPEELALMQTAAEMADAGLAFILERVEPGRTERELALDLEFQMRRAGADDVSFGPIVAAGERSALPHAHPTDRVVEKGEFLLIDLGCVYHGYCSDLTRTVVVGPPSERQREVYEAVAEAQRRGVDSVRAGRPAAEVDRAAREVLSEAGLGEAFAHGVGHGVGLEIHESPTLRAASDDVLRAGEVVTVEPGAYLAGWGGVRIEDLLAVTEEGAEVLSQSPKELLVL
ncbi:MAG: M24 family metallopeptidase [Nocardioidaceae bacterium]